MPAKGTTTGPKRKWLRLITAGLNVLGQDATNQDLEYWLKVDASETWEAFDEKLPPSGTLRNYFTEARKTATGLDRPWSIGQTVTGDAGKVISSSALPFVLQVWQRALVGGRTLTIRQALWCARLVDIHYLSAPDESSREDDWIETAYGFSTLYAAREQIAEYSLDDQGTQTADLDAILAFGMSTLTGSKMADGAGPALDLAIDLGIIPEVVYTFASYSPRLDDEPIRSLRELVVNKILDVVADQSSSVTPSKLEYWPSLYLTLGIRALTSSEDWNSISEEEQQSRAMVIAGLIATSNWDQFRNISRWKPNDWHNATGDQNGE